MRSLADEFTKNCPDDEERVPQGDSCDAVFVMLQESSDSLTKTVKEKCEMLQRYIDLWHNYNNLKGAVSCIIDDVQKSVNKLKETSHNPTVPPTTIVDSANVCMCLFISMYVHVCVICTLYWHAVCFLLHTF